MNNEVKRIDNGTLIRTIILAVALVNQTLVLAGYSPLPFENAELEAGLTALFTAGASLWTWWKNNDISRKARANKGGE